MSDDADKEVDLEVAGQKVRAKGYRLIDLAWLPIVMGVGYTALTLYQHEATAQQERRDIAQTLERSNAAIANSLKESNMATVQAIKELSSEIRKQTVVSKEVACLNDPAMKNRADARDFCKRITRDDR